MKSDTNRFNVFFHSMLDQGVYFAPSVFEAGFVSIAHSDEVIEQTIDAAKKAFVKVAQMQSLVYHLFLRKPEMNFSGFFLSAYLQRIGVS